MCGILGLVHNSNFKISNENFKFINNVNINRGPDNQDIYEYQTNKFNIKLGHTRLSIQDLSKFANQPMESNSGRFVISFNGEIYNHFELRTLINEKVIFKTSSDTETLLGLIENLNFEKTLDLIEGMFAFILLDRKFNKLYIARDVSGEKPLYIGLLTNLIYLSSDLKGIKYINEFNKEINIASIQQFLEFNYIPNPKTIYNSVFKLPPSSYMVFDLNKFTTKKIDKFQSLIDEEGVFFKKWWKLDKKAKINNINFYEAKTLIKETLSKSVKNQMISDVPVGAFLSGGIDSSMIVSLMSKHKSNVNTFTIGYEDQIFDESSHAKKIANYLGTNHENYKFSSYEVIDFIKENNYVFSEPFADSSQLPTLLVSKIAKQNVKVALTGDGGDELFGGYNRYIYANNYWRKIRYIRKFLQIDFVNNLMRNNPKFFIFFINLLTKLNLNSLKYEKIINKIKNLNNEFSYYLSMIKEWRSDDQIMSIPFDNILDENISYNFSLNNLCFEEKMMISDFETYLTDDILCKVDRCSMNYGLETRAPFLNKKLIETAFKLPLDFKIKKFNSKIIIKSILNDFIPEKLYDRPKMGFGIPIGELLRTELKDWAFDILSRNNCNKHNFFNYDIVHKILKNHLTFKENNEFKIWSLIQFNLWYENL